MLERMMDPRLLIIIGVVGLLGHLYMLLSGLSDGSVLRILLGAAFSAVSVYTIRMGWQRLGSGGSRRSDGRY